MRTELQIELLLHYPNLFRPSGKHLFSTSTTTDSTAYLLDDPGPFDERGIECGDGWFAMIDRLSYACVNEIGKLIAEGVPKEHRPRIAQIKEKMGGLRFYVNGSLSEQLREQILQAENEESFCTYERCGAPGKLREGQWRQTYCDDCDA